MSTPIYMYGRHTYPYQNSNSSKYWRPCTIFWRNLQLTVCAVVHILQGIVWLKAKFAYYSRIIDILHPRDHAMTTFAYSLTKQHGRLELTLHSLFFITILSKNFCKSYETILKFFFIALSCRNNHFFISNKFL